MKKNMSRTEIERLDSLVLDARELEVKHHIKRLISSFLNSINPHKVQTYSEVIAQSEYKLTTIILGIEHAIEKCKSMPSIAEVKDYIRIFASENQGWEERERSRGKSSIKETELLDKIREKFNELIGVDRLEDYIRYWYGRKYGNKSLEFANHNIMLWEKPALFDLNKAKWNFDNLDSKKEDSSAVKCEICEDTGYTLFTVTQMGWEYDCMKPCGCENTPTGWIRGR